MSAEILKPFGNYKTPGADAEVIELIRDLLGKAERGEIVCVAVAAIRADGYVLTRANIGTRGQGELIGGIAALQAESIERWRAQ